VDKVVCDPTVVERRRAYHRNYYLKKKAAKEVVEVGGLPSKVIVSEEVSNGIAVNDGGYHDEAVPSLHANIEVPHVNEVLRGTALHVGETPSAKPCIQESCVSDLFTTNTNASSCLHSDISLLDALVGEEGHTFARVKESRRSKNRKHYAKRQACNPSDSAISFIADSVADRQEFGGIYCGNWEKAKELLYTWLQYCKEFFANAKACANCGKFVYGGKYSMHYGKFVVVVYCCGTRILFRPLHFCYIHITSTSL
jgi:hypothetical protein